MAVCDSFDLMMCGKEQRREGEGKVRYWSMIVELRGRESDNGGSAKCKGVEVYYTRNYL